MTTIPITKYLAHEGYGSRRQVESLVRRGKVFINGNVAELGANVTGDEEITVPEYKQQKITTLAYYKPTGIVTVNAQGKEQEIKDRIELPRGVVPIGRLDKDSEGLILLSNDSALPEAVLGSGIEKEYAVEVDKAITHSFLVKMRNGVKIKIPDKKGKMRWYTTKPVKIRRTSKHSFDIVLTEGKNRQIRRMCAALGYGIRQLRRFRIGDIELGKLKPNQYRKLYFEEE